MEYKSCLKLLVGWGRVYRYLGCQLEIVGEPAPTGFIEDFTNNLTIYVWGELTEIFATHRPTIKTRPHLTINCRLV
jgi:hypothetical protein